MKSPGSMASGFLLVDKPAGVTSFAVVDQVRKSLLRTFPHWDPRRRATGGRKRGGPRPPRFKCGHAGTLDPLATGLLLILVGKGSRLAPFLLGLEKSYRATLKFGVATDSLDADGQITSTAPVPADPDFVRQQLPLFQGDILQVPPAVSALKFQGQPLYKLVRQGKPLPELKARPVTISRLEIEDTRWPESEMDLLVECSTGTYIRSLARDLAQAAGTEGHILQLRRLTVGPFAVRDALDGIMERDGENLAANLRPLADALPQVPRYGISEEQAAALRQGTQPSPEWLAASDESTFQTGCRGSIFRLIGPGNELIAVGRLAEDSGLPQIAVVIPAETEASGPCV